MKSTILTSFLLLFCLFTSAQQTITEENTVENQFDKIYRTSTSYKNYKVISKLRYQKLKETVLDSLNKSKKTILEKENLLKTKDHKIESLNIEKSKTQLDLDSSLKKENSILIFGAEINKTTYNIILWSLIFLLLLGLLFFMYKFYNSNTVTKEAKNNLTEVEKEFELHRKKSLEKEQKLRRKLQDEINKQRNA